MKAKVMKRAWEIYRELEGDRSAKMSLALKMAWAEAKAAKKPYVALKVRDKLNLLTGMAKVVSISEHQHGKIFLIGIEYDEYITSSTYGKVSHYEELTVFPTEDGGKVIDYDQRENRHTERGRKRWCKIVDLVCKVEEETEETYVSKVKALTTQLDSYIDTLSERAVKTVYAMLTYFDGSLWVKSDKARIYINDAWNLVEHQKLVDDYGDYHWIVNGVEVEDVIRRSRPYRDFCAQLDQEKIKISFYYDIIANKFYFNTFGYSTEGFGIENTIMESIKEKVTTL